jgi:integrase
MVIPIALPLRVHIDTLPSGDSPDAPLHPRAFAVLARNERAGVLSQHFSDLLAQAGLRKKQSHHTHGIGRSGRRTVNELTFHSLRRTATTWLHEAGVASSVAQALIGHDSHQIHHGYISVGLDALQKAVATLPSIEPPL